MHTSKSKEHSRWITCLRADVIGRTGKCSPILWNVGCVFLFIFFFDDWKVSTVTLTAVAHATTAVKTLFFFAYRFGGMMIILWRSGLEILKTALTLLLYFKFWKNFPDFMRSDWLRQSENLEVVVSDCTYCNWKGSCRSFVSTIKICY